jgi:hypothetical protein
VGTEKTYKYPLAAAEQAANRYTDERIAEIAIPEPSEPSDGQWLPNTTSSESSTGVTDAASLAVKGGASLEMSYAAQLEMAGSAQLGMTGSANLQMADGAQLEMDQGGRLHVFSTMDGHAEYANIPELAGAKGSYIASIDSGRIRGFILNVDGCGNMYYIEIARESSGEIWNAGSWIKLNGGDGAGAGTIIWRSANDISSPGNVTNHAISNALGTAVEPKPNDFILIVNNSSTSGKVYRITSVTNWTGSQFSGTVSDQGTIRGAQGDPGPNGADGLDGNADASLVATVTVSALNSSIDWGSIPNIGTASFLKIDNSPVINNSGNFTITNVPTDMVRVMFCLASSPGNINLILSSTSSLSSPANCNVSQTQGAVMFFSGNRMQYSQAGAGGSMS